MAITNGNVGNIKQFAIVIGDFKMFHERKTAKSFGKIGNSGTKVCRCQDCQKTKQTRPKQDCKQLRAKSERKCRALCHSNGCYARMLNKAWHHLSVVEHIKAFFNLMIDFTGFCDELRSAGGHCRNLPTCGCL